MTEVTHEPDSVVEYEQPPASPYVSQTAIAAVRTRETLEQRLANLRAEWRKVWMEARDTPIQRVLRMLDALDWPNGFIHTIEGEEVACVILKGAVRPATFGDIYFDDETVVLCSNGRVSQVGKHSWSASWEPFTPRFTDAPRYVAEIVVLEQQLLTALLA